MFQPRFKSRHFSVLVVTSLLSLIGCGRSSTLVSTLAGDSSSVPCQSQSEDIADRLACIPGLTFTEVTNAIDPTAQVPAGYRRFDMQFEQPVDHDLTDGATFSQKLVLLHLDDNAPMLLQTSGYSIFGVALTQVASTLGMNQLQVEHRFFSTSIPDAAQRDWHKLNITQSAADFHAITVSLKQIYTARWLNTGASKGGMTSVYHRRFYPNDLDGTLAYVAPLSFSTADERYVTFVDQQAGGATWSNCRASLETLQRTLLQRRADIVGTMSGSFDQLGSANVAFEHAVIELPFAFWQYQSPTSPTLGCARIPTATASTSTLLAYLNAVNSPEDGYSDDGMSGFIPYYYQAAGQLGGPGAKLSHIADLLQHADTYNLAQYIPRDLDVTYDSAAAMRDVEQWVANESDKIMFVYGGFDPWTAGAFTARNDGRSVKYIAATGNHGASVFTLSATDKAAALTTLKQWLNIDEAESNIAAASVSNGPTLEEIEATHLRHGPRF